MNKFSRVLVAATYHTLLSSSVWLFSQARRPMSVSNTTLSASPPLDWWMVEIVIRGLPENFSPLRRQERRYSRSSGAMPRNILIQSNCKESSGSPRSVIEYFSSFFKCVLNPKNCTMFFASCMVRYSFLRNFSQLIIALVSSDSNECLPLYEYEWPCCRATC